MNSKFKLFLLKKFLKNYWLLVILFDSQENLTCDCSVQSLFELQFIWLEDEEFRRTKILFDIKFNCKGSSMKARREEFPLNVLTSLTYESNKHFLQWGPLNLLWKDLEEALNILPNRVGRKRKVMYRHFTKWEIFVNTWQCGFISAHKQIFGI